MILSFSLLVALADVSMSLDNAVAGAAREHPGDRHDPVGRADGIAANFIARSMERYRWPAWFGLAVILHIAGKMIYDGIINPEVGLMILFA